MRLILSILSVFFAGAGLCAAVNNPYLLGGAPSSAFTPANYGPVEQWQSHTTLSGTNLSPWGTWADSSGNGRTFTVSTAGYRPLLYNNWRGTNSALKFDGVDDYLRSTNATGVSTKTFLVVFENNASIVNAGVIVHAPGGTNDYTSPGGEVLDVKSGPVVFQFYNNAGLISITGAPPVVPMVYAEDSFGGTNYCYTNGVFLGSYPTYGVTATNGLLMGSRWIAGAVSPSYPFKGWVSEFVKFSASIGSNNVVAASVALKLELGLP
jgi:hypothetical protein